MPELESPDPDFLAFHTDAEWTENCLRSYLELRGFSGNCVERGIKFLYHVRSIEDADKSVDGTKLIVDIKCTTDEDEQCCCFDWIWTSFKAFL